MEKDGETVRAYSLGGELGAQWTDKEVKAFLADIPVDMTPDEVYTAIVGKEPTNTVRFSVTLPKQIERYLSKWAREEGRNKGSLAAFLVEYAVRLRYPEVFAPSANSYPPRTQPPKQSEG